MPEQDAVKIKFHFSLREIVYVVAVIAGMAGHAIRTEVLNDQCQAELHQLNAQITTLKMELQELYDKRNGTGR